MPANLTSGSVTSPTTSEATASITITADRLTLLAITVQTNDSSTPPTITPTATGVTFTSLQDNLYDNSGVDRVRQQAWRAMPASNATGAITIALSASARTLVWTVDEFDGVDTGGTNGSAAVVQSAKAGNTSNVTSRTVTLASFADATNNWAWGVFAQHRGNATPPDMTEGSGFTKLAEPTGAQAGDSVVMLSEYVLGEDTSVDVTSDISKPIGGIAVEVAASGSETGAAADGEKMGDSATALATPIAAASADGQKMGDTAAGAASGGSVAGAAADGMTLSDITSEGLTVPLDSDGMSMGDAAVVTVSDLVHAAVDGLSMGDSAIAVVTAFNLFDGMSMGDSASAFAGVSETAGDGMAMGDSAMATLPVTEQTFSTYDAIGVREHLEPVRKRKRL